MIPGNVCQWNFSFQLKLSKMCIQEIWWTMFEHIKVYRSIFTLLGIFWNKTLFSLIILTSWIPSRFFKSLKPILASCITTCETCAFFICFLYVFVFSEIVFLCFPPQNWNLTLSEIAPLLSTSMSRNSDFTSFNEILSQFSSSTIQISWILW